MENKAEGRFNYMAGVEVIGDAAPPDGLERFQLAAQMYVVFRLTLDGGPLHPRMQAAMPKIWGDMPPKAGSGLKICCPEEIACRGGFISPAMANI